MGVNIPNLPTVGPDIYTYLIEIDAAILQASISWEFSVEVDVPPFEGSNRTPVIVYELLRVYKERQFQAVYFGATGKLKLTWSNPNLYDSDIVAVSSYAKYESIFELNYGFRASLLYLSMTNGEDLRRITPNILKRRIVSELKLAHARGEPSIKIPFGRCPVESLQELYAEVTTWLEASEHVTYSWDVVNSFLVVTFVVQNA